MASAAQVGQHEKSQRQGEKGNRNAAISDNQCRASQPFAVPFHLNISAHGGLAARPGSHRRMPDEALYLGKWE